MLSHGSYGDYSPSNYDVKKAAESLSKSSDKKDGEKK